MTSPLHVAVAHELEQLSAPDGPLDPLGGRATWSQPLGVTARRGVDIAQRFFDLQSEVNAGGRVAIVTAGPPGSGKSTWIERSELRRAGFREIDPDVIKDLLLQDDSVREALDDLLTHRLPDDRPVMVRELSGLVHAESARIAHNILDIALRRGEDIVVPGTLGWVDLPDRLLNDFGVHGYDDLTIVDVEVPQNVAVERSLARWWEGRTGSADKLGGRFVPRRVIAGLYSEAGTTVCRANALYMFDKSPLETTALITIDGETGETIERRKLDGEELPVRMPSAVDGQSGDTEAAPSSPNGQSR